MRLSPFSTPGDSSATSACTPTGIPVTSAGDSVGSADGDEVGKEAAGAGAAEGPLDPQAVSTSAQTTPTRARLGTTSRSDP